MTVTKAKQIVQSELNKGVPGWRFARYELVPSMHDDDVFDYRVEGNSYWVPRIKAALVQALGPHAGRDLTPQPPNGTISVSAQLAACGITPRGTWAFERTERS